MAESSPDVIKRYLDDAVAAEKSSETQLHRSEKEANDESTKALFHELSLEAKRQYERLTARLHVLGGSPSGTKSFFAHTAFDLKAVEAGHEIQERAAHNLVLAYALASNKVAIYESLATTADAAGDSDTSDLARDIQAEEQASAQKIWSLLPAVALEITAAYRAATARERS